MPERLEWVRPAPSTFGHQPRGSHLILPLIAGLGKRCGPYVAQVPGNVAPWSMDVAQAGRGRPAKHAKVQDPDVRPLTMAAWKDRLQQASAWKEVKMPRADESRVRAVVERVRASQREGRWR